MQLGVKSFFLKNDVQEVDIFNSTILHIVIERVS
jgi:hypothetical protein